MSSETSRWRSRKAGGEEHQPIQVGMSGSSGGRRGLPPPTGPCGGGSWGGGGGEACSRGGGAGGGGGGAGRAASERRDASPLPRRVHRPLKYTSARAISCTPHAARVKAAERYAFENARFSKEEFLKDPDFPFMSDTVSLLAASVLLRLRYRRRHLAESDTAFQFEGCTSTPLDREPVQDVAFARPTVHDHLCQTPDIRQAGRPHPWRQSLRAAASQRPVDGGPGLGGGGRRGPPITGRRAAADAALERPFAAGASPPQLVHRPRPHLPRSHKVTVGSFREGALKGRQVMRTRLSADSSGSCAGWAPAAAGEQEQTQGTSAFVPRRRSSAFGTGVQQELLRSWVRARCSTVVVVMFPRA